MANKKKVIYADDLLAAIRDDQDINGANFARFKRHIEAATAVDAVEVVHGQWIKTYTCHGERLWGYECDQCKADSGRASYYCPNCGAKMDGDVNG